VPEVQARQASGEEQETVTVQQQAARLTRQAWEGLLRTAEFVPVEKRDWVPQGKARTFYDFMAECALVSDWGAAFFQTGKFPPHDPEAYSRARAELDTLEKIKAAGDPAIERLCAAIEAIPDAKLAESHDLPWGMTMTMADMLFMGYWNLTYHMGQVNYIQMLLGDTEMH
jgi:DinB superfamily